MGGPGAPLAGALASEKLVGDVAVQVDRRKHSRSFEEMIANEQGRGQGGVRGILMSVLVVSLATFALAGCRITENDVDSWARKASGPRKLIAVVQHDKYEPDLRVSAAMTLVTMKPRGGRAVGLVGSDEFTGLLDGLLEMSAEDRLPIVSGMVPRLVDGMAFVPEGEESDESIPYKDGAYALLTHKDGVIVSSEEARLALKQALVQWCQHNFVARMDNTSQLYGMEQVLRYVRGPGVRGLTKLIEPDFKKLRELSQLIKELGDPATKLEASRRMVALARYVDSAAWIKQKAPAVEAANKASGLSVKANQFEKQLEAYQEEEMLRVFAAMKDVGQEPIVDYLLAYAAEEEHAETRRAAALAALENNLDRRNEAHAKAMLDYLSSDETPDTIRDVAARRVGELSREQVAKRLYELFDHERWQIRWTVASLLLKMTGPEKIDEFMEELGKVREMAMTEPLTYGPLLADMKGDTQAMVESFIAPGRPAPVRLSALGYYYEHGTQADLSKVESLTKDSQRVPRCPPKATQCAWTCTVPGEKEATNEEVATVGEFVEYCILPAMKGRTATSPGESAEQSSLAP